MSHEPPWAYQTENFVSQPDGEFICSICQGVLCDPVECPCQHAFCRGCVTKWLKRRRECPLCRIVTTETLLRPVTPLLRNVILKMEIKCRNRDVGCQDTFKLEQWQTHMKHCLYEEMKCTLGCGESFARKERDDHNTSKCPRRFGRCNLNCRVKIVERCEDHNCQRVLEKSGGSSGWPQSTNNIFAPAKQTQVNTFGSPNIKFGGQPSSSWSQSPPALFSFGNASTSANPMAMDGCGDISQNPFRLNSTPFVFGNRSSTDTSRPLFGSAPNGSFQSLFSGLQTNNQPAFGGQTIFRDPPLFGNPPAGPSGSTEGSQATFRQATELAMNGGVYGQATLQFQSVTAATTSNGNMSFEELRCQDYNAGLKGPTNQEGYVSPFLQLPPK